VANTGTAALLARLAPLAICSFVVATDGTLVVGLLPHIAGGVDASLPATGQGVTVFALAYAAGSPGVVAATRSWPAKRLLLVALVAFVAANAATGVAASLPGFLIARTIAGLSAGVVMPTAATIASARSGRHERGRALAVVVGGASAAAVVGVPLGTAAGVYLGWRVAFFTVAAFGLALGALLARQPLLSELEPRAQSTNGRRRTAVALVMSVTLLWSAGSFTFFSYLTLVLHTTGAVGGFGVAGELMLFGVAGVFGAYLSGRLTDGRGPVPVAAVALATMTMSEVGFAVAAAVKLGSGAAVVLTSALVALYGLGTWAVTPPQQHRLVGLAPEAPRMLLSLNATGLYAGVAVGGAAGAAVIATSHSVIVLCLVAAALPLASLLTLLASARVVQEVISRDGEASSSPR
jgi:predicted MFS family arabinose efflux permease